MTSTFATVKKMTTEAPCLKPLVVGKRCIVMVDASSCGLGAVLIQEEWGKEWIVDYASRTLRESERHYSVIEKELLACVWGAEHFRPFLWGTKFTKV